MGGLGWTSNHEHYREIHPFFVKEHSYLKKNIRARNFYKLYSIHKFFSENLGSSHKLQNVEQKKTKWSFWSGLICTSCVSQHQAIRNVHQRRQSRWSRHLLHRKPGEENQGSQETTCNSNVPTFGRSKVINSETQRVKD